MNVNLSCHRAFLGSRVLAPAVAMRPTAATPAREMAEVRVNTLSGELMVGGEKRWGIANVNCSHATKGH